MDKKKWSLNKKKIVLTKSGFQLLIPNLRLQKRPGNNFDGKIMWQQFFSNHCQLYWVEHLGFKNF